MVSTGILTSAHELPWKVCICNDDLGWVLMTGIQVYLLYGYLICKPILPCCLLTRDFCPCQCVCLAWFPWSSVLNNWGFLYFYFFLPSVICHLGKILPDFWGSSGSIFSTLVITVCSRICQTRSRLPWILKYLTFFFAFLTLTTTWILEPWQWHMLVKWFLSDTVIQLDAA